MRQIFLPPPDLSFLFPWWPPSLHSLYASHWALSCLSPPLLIFLLCSVESAQAWSNHINLWVVRVSDPSPDQDLTSRFIVSQTGLLSLQIRLPDVEAPACPSENHHSEVTWAIFVAPMKDGNQTVPSECHDLLFTSNNLIHSSASARSRTNGATDGVFHAGVAATVQGWFVFIHQNSCWVGAGRLQLSTPQEHPGPCLRFVSAVGWSILTIPLLRRLKTVSWTTRNCSWTPAVTSTQQH